MRRGAAFSRALLAATALSGFPLASVRADTPKWGAWVDVGGRAGETRRIGEVDTFLPVAQDSRSLLFLDLRTSYDNQDQHEGNFGLGYRAMQDSGWNLGAYGFFDRRRSSESHYFNQFTVGLEALGEDFDARANAYLPQGRQSYDIENSTRLDLSGGTILIQSDVERAYRGGDAELGWRVPVFGTDQDAELRMYGGGYWFDAKLSDAVIGPRARLELRLYDPVEVLPGSRITASAELQRDDVRGTQHFLGLKLRIPLQAETATARLSPQERRMTDPLIRDVDIVTQSATVKEAATFAGQKLSTLTTIAEGANVQSVIDKATAGTLLALNSTANVSSQVTLRPGQTLASGGNVLSLTGANSGRTVTLTVPGGAGTLRGTVAGDSVLKLSSGSNVRGLTVENTSTANNSYAVSAVNATGASIVGATLQSAKGAALLVDNSNSATVGRSTITASDGAGVSLRNSARATLTDNIVQASSSGSSALSVDDADDSTFTGNTVRASGWHGTAFSVSGSSGLNLSNNTVAASGAGASALRMDQSSGTISGNAISATGAGDGTTNPRALWISQGGGSTVTNNTVSASGQYGSALYVDHANNSTFTGNTVRASGWRGTAFMVSGTNGLTLSNNTVAASGAGANALRMDQSSGTISGNTISTTGTGDGTTNPYALWITQGGGSTIAGNTVSASGQYGSALYVDNSGAIAISGNRLTANGYAGRGLQLFNSAGSTVSGNTITTTDTTTGTGFYTSATALFMESSANTTISGNTLTTIGFGAAGMNLRYSAGLTVTDNTITTSGVQSSALVLTGSNGSSVKNNRTSTTGSSANGIQIFLNSNNVRIEGNTVTTAGSGASPVDVTSSSGVTVVNNRLTGVGNGGVTSASAGGLTVSGNTP